MKSIGVGVLARVCAASSLWFMGCGAQTSDGLGAQMGLAGAAAGSAADGGGAGAPAAPTFTQVYALFSEHCAGACHFTGTPGGLSLANQADAYQNLVGVTSKACPNTLRVAAGDPDASELVNTLDHSAIDGCAKTPAMPVGRPQLQASEVDLVRAWIAAGAHDD